MHDPPVQNMHARYAVLNRVDAVPMSGIFMSKVKAMPWVSPFASSCSIFAAISSAVCAEAATAKARAVAIKMMILFMIGEY